ncbi:hypothetical protein ACUJ40_04800 [Halococcus saccharolyticus]|uniref:hypothetical protein n=1 Tax=Halococcus saccharolyticus TaxID=62319 RepID=UPI0012672153|nr:hypothetical protein [Halococcus saccharolyticus]
MEFANVGSDHDTSLYNRLKAILPPQLKGGIPSSTKLLARKWTGYEKSWYEGRGTIDERIYRLRPFEEISSMGRNISFEPDFSLSSDSKLIKLTAIHLESYINEIERKYPEYHNIILMGGKDSQIIGLVPKITDSWSVFSADPNFPLVQKFIKENDIKVEKLYRYDGKNREDRATLTRKMICSDLRADPRHIRWRRRLREIADSYDSKCIFWSGTEADTIFSHFPLYHNQNREEYFSRHFTRATNFQGTTHQTTKNFTGCPMISPYHSERFWRTVMEHYDPGMISKNTDLRKRLGERVAGQSVSWPKANPAPDPYRYDYSVNGYQMYVDYIKSIVNDPRQSVISNRERQPSDSA